MKNALARNEIRIRGIRMRYAYGSHENGGSVARQPGADSGGSRRFADARQGSQRRWTPARFAACASGSEVGDITNVLNRR